MLVKFFGIVDITIGLILIFKIINYIPDSLLIILGVILLAKSSISLLKDVGGWIDLSVTIILFLSTIISIPLFIGFLFGALILQKGIFSCI